MAKKKTATDPKSTLPGNMTEAEARKVRRMSIANHEKRKRDALKEQKKLKQYNDMVANLADTDPSVKRELTRRAEEEGLTLEGYMIGRRGEENKQRRIAGGSALFADIKRESAAERNREKRDERLANARRLRAQGRRRGQQVSASDIAISEATGDEAGRVGIERQRYASRDIQDVSQPIDATFDGSGAIKTKNLKDNQIIKNPDGTFLKYNTEDGSLTPHEFDVASDSFKPVKGPEPVRTGVQKLESLIPSQLDAARKFAEENSDDMLMNDYRIVQAELDAINGDPTLTQEERDNAIRNLQKDARNLFDRASFGNQTKNEQAQEAARQKAFADQQEAERAAKIKIKEAMAAVRETSSQERSQRTTTRAQEKQSQLSGYRSQFDQRVADAKSQLDTMRTEARESNLSLQDYAESEGMVAKEFSELIQLAAGGDEQFKLFFGKQLDDDNIKDSYDDKIFDRMQQNEEAYVELNELQDLVSGDRTESFIKAIAGTKDASGNTISRNQAAQIWVQQTEETMNSVARLEKEINDRKQEVLELKRRGTIVYEAPDGSKVSFEDHQRAQATYAAAGIRPVGVQEARLIAAQGGGLSPAQSTRNPETGQRVRSVTGYPDLPIGMASREIQADANLAEMNPVEFGNVPVSSLPNGAQVIYGKFTKDPSKYMDAEEYNEYIQMDESQKHRAVMYFIKDQSDRSRRSTVNNEEARRQMEKSSRAKAFKDVFMGGSMGQRMDEQRGS